MSDMFRRATSKQANQQHDLDEKIGMQYSDKRSGSSLCVRWRGWLRGQSIMPLFLTALTARARASASYMSVAVTLT